VWKRVIYFHNHDIEVLKDHISHLKNFGATCSLEVAAAEVRKRKQESVSQINRDNILVVLVIVSMLGFSVIMLISCHRILCDEETSPKSS
jgi:hypothetical protein